MVLTNGYNSFNAKSHKSSKKHVYNFSLSLSLSLSLFLSLFPVEASRRLYISPRGLVPRDPRVSQQNHFTLTYKIMYSYVGVGGVGWETYGSLETSGKGKGR